MDRMHKGTIIIVWLVIWGMILLPFGGAYGRVIVFDSVTAVKRPVYLKVLTKGKLLPRGGERVSLQVNGVKIGNILTGGDGYGFLKYTPQTSGNLKVETDPPLAGSSGLLVVADTTDKFVVIELKSSLQDILTAKGDLNTIRPVLEKLESHYRLIYLGGRIGWSITKTLLSRYQMPAGALLGYSGPTTLKVLKDRDIRLYAVVASADTLSEIGKYFEMAFSFEKTSHGKRVKSWQDVERELEPVTGDSKP